MRIDELETPCYVIDEGRLTDNLKILNGVMTRTGAKILLAQKAFSAFYEYPLIGQYLSGTTASGLYEARLAHEEMGKENHVFCPAFLPEEMDELVRICDHIVFNSVSQYLYHQPKIEAAKKLQLMSKRVGKDGQVDGGDIVSVGIRINPECSTQEGHEIYDPCGAGSRLGITRAELDKALENGLDLSKIDGLHFHTLCEQNSDDLEKTLAAVEEKFGDLLYDVRWLNMGGGHHITREDYDISRLEKCIRHMQEKYNLEIYLEPGEAVALNAGYLVTTVLDIVKNGEINILILDTSAACHMPDVLEMPYRPPLRDSGEAGEKKYTYRLSSCTCLAGDVIGDYSFDKEIKIGDRLTFCDMAIYSMVKNNTFNGMPLPDIAVMEADGECKVIRRFGYEDFKNRLS